MSWLQFLTTDAQSLGILSWASTGLAILGFWIALAQIRKTRGAAEAAAIAGQEMAALVRRRDQESKLEVAITQLRMSSLLIQRNEIFAAAAYLEMALRLIAELRELAVQGERSAISAHLDALRLLLDAIQPSRAGRLRAPARSVEVNDIRKAIATFEEFAARLRYGNAPGVSYDG